MVTKKYRQTLNIRYIMPQIGVNVTKTAAHSSELIFQPRPLIEEAMTRQGGFINAKPNAPRGRTRRSVMIGASRAPHLAPHHPVSARRPRLDPSQEFGG
jgi:hypothetical protein